MQDEAKEKTEENKKERKNLGWFGIIHLWRTRAHGWSWPHPLVDRQIYQPIPFHPTLLFLTTKGEGWKEEEEEEAALVLSRRGKKEKEMASFVIAMGPVAGSGRLFAATAAKGGSSSEEKGLLDWILGGLQKEDQLVETDPILKKVEDKNGGGSQQRRTSVSVPPSKKKNGGGGFGGLFAKK